MFHGQQGLAGADPRSAIDDGGSVSVDTRGSEALGERWLRKEVTSVVGVTTERKVGGAGYGTGAGIDRLGIPPVAVGGAHVEDLHSTGSARFGDVGGELRRAATQYANEVASGAFPAEEHSF